MSDKSCPVPESFQSMFWSILYLTLIFFLTFISRFIFSPLLPTISADLGISAGQAGSIFLISSLGFMFGAIFSGFVSSRINHRGTLILSIFCVSIALLVCVTMTSLAIIRLAMLVIGIAAGFNLPSITAIVTAIVSRPDWGKALAVQQLAPPMSLILGPLLVVFVLHWFQWRFLMGGIALFVFLMAITLVISRIGDFPGDAPRVALARFIFAQR
ncbi:MAG: MFS transporter, partial [Deltaproteobacteria bacterium]|nr:MFS transporter [Deltaproteobacteria bacterium]